MNKKILDNICILGNGTLGKSYKVIDRTAN